MFRCVISQSMVEQATRRRSCAYSASSPATCPSPVARVAFTCSTWVTSRTLERQGQNSMRAAELLTNSAEAASDCIKNPRDSATYTLPCFPSM